MPFKVGDRVQWDSQAGGFVTTKAGEVAAVIAPGQRVWMPAGLRFRSVVGAGRVRDHESFIVKVGNVAYWPSVALLRPVTPPDPEILKVDI